SGGRAAGREHGGDHHVRGSQQVSELGVRGAERGAEDGQRGSATFGQGLAKRVDEGGIPGQLVRPVEHHRHHRRGGFMIVSGNGRYVSRTAHDHGRRGGGRGGGGWRGEGIGGGGEGVQAVGGHEVWGVEGLAR